MESSGIQGRAKVTVVGAGHVGATTAHWLAEKGIADVTLLDIVEGLAAGKALDLAEAAPIAGFDAGLVGTTDYADTAGSDVVVITAGLARKPGMSRDDLVRKNTAIVAEVTRQVVAHSPQATLVVVSNPLDVMVHVAGSVSGFPRNRVMGMAGVLDSARYRAFIAEAVGVSVKDITTMLLGGHGDDMVPLPRYTTISGIPLAEWLTEEQIDAIVTRTRKGGGEIVNLLKTGSAFYAPAAGAAEMVEAILLDRKRVLPCCAWCDAEYGVGGAFVGVPVVLGAGGVEKVIQLALSESERAQLADSVERVKALNTQVDAILAE